MIGEKTLDIIDNCLDQHDAAITANTTLIEEVMVCQDATLALIESLEVRLAKLVGQLAQLEKWAWGDFSGPAEARAAAEDRAFAGNRGMPCEPSSELIKLILMEDDEDGAEVEVPIALRRRLRRIGREKG